MVMVAATAIGLKGSIFIWHDGWPITWINWQDVSRATQECFYLAIPCLASWTLALSFLALKRPRDSIRRLTRQPGVVGCWAASTALLFDQGTLLAAAVFNSDVILDLEH